MKSQRSPHASCNYHAMISISFSERSCIHVLSDHANRLPRHEPTPALSRGLPPLPHQSFSRSASFQNGMRNPNSPRSWHVACEDMRVNEVSKKLQLFVVATKSIILLERQNKTNKYGSQHYSRQLATPRKVLG